MRILQTPESCFANLKDYPFQSHFIDINGLMMHYVDEGPADSTPVLLLHGVPAWSYLYRHMIQRIASTGVRVIAPDLIGFGKSDKPLLKKDHSYTAHTRWIKKFIELLDLKKILLFAHDWGSLIGLRIAAEVPDRFAGIIISNGMLPTGEHKIHYSFNLWKIIAKYSPFLPVDQIIEIGLRKNLNKEEKRAYRAPFPSSGYKSGIRALPGMVPVTPSDPEAEINCKAWKTLENWNKPFLTVFSNNDPITHGADEYMQKRIPGASGQDHSRLDGGHFIQEEHSEELAGIIIKFRAKIDSGLSQ
jgi:haloalkane dehalogenase